MKRIQTYTFKEITNCNMCGSDSTNFNVMGKRLNRSQGFNPKQKTGISTTIVQCNSCGLIFSNPQPIPENIQDHYGVVPEAYWQDSYFQIDKNYFLGEIAWLNRLQPFNKGMKSLDIGAGIGKQMLALQKVGYDVYGFEPSSQFRDRAIEKMGILPEKLKLGSVEEVHYENDQFDFISFGAVLEHLYDPGWAIQKAMQWLKKGGLIHIEVPSSSWLIHRLINGAYRLRGMDYVGNLSPMHTPYHLHEFALKSFERHSEMTSNYEIADHAFYVCETYMPKFLDPFLKRYMRATNTGMQLCIWLRK